MSGGSANDEFDFDSAGDDGQDPFSSGFDDNGGGAQPMPKSAKISAKKSAEKFAEKSHGVEPAAPLAPPTVALHIHLSQIRTVEKREPSTFDVMQVCIFNKYLENSLL